MKKWKCAVCGYEFDNGDQPEKCPACGAAAAKLSASGQSADAGGEAVQKVQQEAEDQSAKTEGDGAEKKWRCTVCNYIHTGPEPPDPCPVCGADSSFFVEVTGDEEGGGSTVKQQQEKQPQPVASGGSGEEKQKPQAAQKDSSSKKPGKSGAKNKEAKPFGALGALVMHFHFHPISVHIPNGVLPVAALFLLLAILIGYTPLETASFFNFIVVLLAMPLVFATGFIAWQRKYNGALTSLFKTKLICTAVVTGSVTLLVIYRLVDPTVALTEGSGRWVYLVLVGVALAAATIAGSLGGRLVFRK
ncbi:MAG TPA: DUF2231 domain-containing protein [Desulfopila sp.]|nr:DUF2231 domain-containing protein [Desulfopila sp.]